MLYSLYVQVYVIQGGDIPNKATKCKSYNLIVHIYNYIVLCSPKLSLMPLSYVWSVMCTKEKNMADNKSDKRRLKTEYVMARNSFDTENQRVKRFYWYSMQHEILN